MRTRITPFSPSARPFALGLAALAMAVGGCSSSQNAEGDKPTPTIDTVVRNETTATARVTLTLGTKSNEAGFYDLVEEGAERVIPVGQVASVSVDEPSGWFRKPDVSRMVPRLRIESWEPTWSRPSVHWFEVLGPVPQTIRLTSDGAGTSMSMEVASLEPRTPVRPIPEQHWPAADRREHGTRMAGAGADSE